MNAESEMSGNDGLGSEPQNLDPVKQIAESVGYSDGMDDDDESGIDVTINYKNALEDAVRQLTADRETVEVVEVAFDNTFLFANARDAQRFYNAVKSRGGDPYGSEGTILVGELAEVAILAERCEALEEHMPTLAKDILNGLSLPEARARVKSLGPGDFDVEHVEALLTEWIEIDNGQAQ